MKSEEETWLSAAAEEACMELARDAEGAWPCALAAAAMSTAAELAVVTVEVADVIWLGGIEEAVVKATGRVTLL